MPENKEPRLCTTCNHDEMDHIVDPMSKIAWCGYCGDEFINDYCKYGHYEEGNEHLPECENEIATHSDFEFIMGLRG